MGTNNNLKIGIDCDRELCFCSTRRACAPMAQSHYDVLGVSRSASTAEIRRAYRTQALRWHPDKNPQQREVAEKRFVQLGEAYEVLSDEVSRTAYDRGADSALAAGPNFSGPFGMHRAAAIFRENFGESLASEWRPGMMVQGSLVRGGKRVTVTIHPDGTSEEHEEDAGKGEYTYVSRSGAGGSYTSIQFNGSPGQALAAMLVPQTMQRVPIVGPAVTTAVEWVPAMMCLGCCYTCCCRGFFAGGTPTHLHGA